MPFHCVMDLVPPPEAVPVVNGYGRDMNEALERVPELFFWSARRLEPAQLGVQMLENCRQLLSRVAHMTVSPNVYDDCARLFLTLG